jgi:hypothetical protein
MKNEKQEYRKYSTFKLSLYIETRRGYTPKGGLEKNTFLCYPTFRKKETSGKEVE